MRNITIKNAGFAVLFTCVLCLLSFTGNDNTMKKENDVYIVNTTQIGKNIKGKNGPTPLCIYIKKNKIEKIEFLNSQETPKFYDRVKKVLSEKWNNMKVNDAKNLKVDAVTGATYSSEAVIKNVKTGLDYYISHK